MSKDKLRQLADALSVILALTVNILANALPLNGQNTGEISNRFRVYFVPAGYVFAIWGIIYIGWIAFVVYQFLPTHQESPRCIQRRLVGMLALQPVRAERAGHVGLAGPAHRQLSKTRCWAHTCRQCRKVVCGCSLQCVSRLDLRRHGRQHHILSILHQMDRLRDRASDLGGHHAGGCKFAWNSHDAHAQG
jgi:hypothetical protein